MINHSRKSRDKRYRYARDRWSRLGVHNQVAEGHQRLLKWQFGAGYSYISPEKMPLYLDEYSFIRNIRYYGFDSVVKESNRKSTDLNHARRGSVVCNEGLLYPQEKSWLEAELKRREFKPLTLEERRILGDGNDLKLTPLTVSNLERNGYSPEIIEAIENQISFWQMKQPDFKKRREKKYSSIANKLWAVMPNSWVDFVDLYEQAQVDRNDAMRIIHNWVILGIITIVDRTKPNGLNFKLEYDIRSNVETLPKVLYGLDRANYKKFKSNYNSKILEDYPDE